MSYTHLTFEQRYHIQVDRSNGLLPPVIARRLGLHRSTVYRELARGQDPNGYYSAARADHRAQLRRAPSAANHPTKPAALWRWVASCLRKEDSPDEIAGRLPLVCPGISVSVPAIYAYVRRNERAQGQIYKHMRRAAKRALWRSSSGGMPADRPSILKRPRIIHERIERGHWESDTARGKTGQPRCLLTSVERTSRYTRLALLPRATSEVTAKALARSLASYQVKSITFDNGTEFAQYETACKHLGAKAYFAQPARPWQRGTCENTIGLIRQYLPKYTSMQKLTAAKVQWIENRLNHRPRKCLGYLTPHEVLFNLKPTPVALRT